MTINIVILSTRQFIIHGKFMDRYCYRCSKKLNILDCARTSVVDYCKECWFVIKNKRQMTAEERQKHNEAFQVAVDLFVINNL